MNLRADREIKFGPLLMGLLATIGTQAFRLSCQWDPWIVWAELGLTVLLLASIYGLRFRDSQFGFVARQPLSRSTICGAVLYLLVTVLPVLVQAITRPFAMGDPAEVVMLTMLQNGALATVAISSQPRPMLISILLSSFQLLFVGFAFAGPLTYGLAGIGTFVVLWWLMGNYWSRIESHQASRVERRIPMRGRVLLSTAGFVAVVVLAVLPILPHRAWTTLQGLMPTSGGDLWGDEFARSGVGNGEILTGATDQADTIGPVDSDVYLSSQQPSLYDMLSMAYGKPNKNQERRIDVSGQEIQEHGHEKMQETAASKEFSTSRSSRRQKVKLDRRDSPALLFVQGQVPLHVRLQAYEQFDGVSWQPAESIAQPTLEMVKRNDQHWMQIKESRADDLLPGSQWHNVCIVNLQTKIIPHTHLLTHWQVPKVDNPNFFGWTAGDSPEMVGRERIPVLTPVDLISLVPNRYQLLSREQRPEGGRNLASSGSDYLKQAGLSEQFAGTPWQQVEQVEQYLRARYELRNDEAVPESVVDTVRYFEERGGGPDFLFATTAVCWLRELGIPARLVQGFYADAAEYDRKSKKTIVWPDNVHTWCEVCLDGQHWLPVEPTPGFELPRRDLTRWQWLSLAVGGALDHLRFYWPAWTVFAAAMVLITVYREIVVDLGCRWSWAILGWLPSAIQVRLCLWLLQQRARIAGLGRRHTETWRTWYRRLVLPRRETANGEAVSAAAHQTFAWYDQILYRHGQQPWQMDRRRVHQVCSLALGLPFPRRTAGNRTVNQD